VSNSLAPESTAAAAILRLELDPEARMEFLVFIDGVTFNPVCCQWAAVFLCLLQVHFQVDDSVVTTAKFLVRRFLYQQRSRKEA